MVAKIHSLVFSGIEPVAVEVQVQLAAGLPAFAVVGLPDKAVAESRERVRAAIAALGLSLPAKRIVVNLAPADLAKEGSHFDLPIALGLLVAMGVVPSDAVESTIVLGELGLDGTILPVNGILPAAIAAAARGQGILCPEANGAEAAWAGELSILAAPSLLALINHFKGTQVLSAPEKTLQADASRGPDMAEVRGQQLAKRALEIAAAGGHNLLMQGPPGAGKSMLASCLPGILPPLSTAEILEVSTIASVAGKLTGGRLTTRRPYRDPHHSISMPAMVGGGRQALPGEISLAHRGVLFLDELPEFPRGVLEALRQPLEAGTVSVARAQAHVTYPARFQLIAAMNPCRCGYLDDAERACSKAPKCAEDYRGKISGPLLDRFDIFIDVPAVDTLDMLKSETGEPSAAVAGRVAAARTIQAQRMDALGLAGRTNAELSGDSLQQHVAPEQDGLALLEDATARLQLSMRGYTRVLRVARSIADLAGSENVTREHIAEALQFRPVSFLRSTKAA